MDNVIPKKSLGQHWLNDTATLQAICEAGDIKKSDTVLEIGPGLGTLTKLLVELADKIVAVEFDKTLAVRLPERIKAQNLTVVEQDILAFDLTSMPTNYKVVANIPYYLTSNLIRVLSETPNQASRVVLLIQKEVAERVGAKAGGMSLLSVSAQFYWDVELGEVVSSKLFTPPPKVDSQVIILSRRSSPLFENVDHKRFFQLVKAGFAARRKTLLNSLAGGLRLEKQQTEGLLAQAQIASGLRPQALTLDDWHRLYVACVAEKIL